MTGPMRSLLKIQSLLLLVLPVLLLACGQLAEQVRLIADEAATADQAGASNFKFCRIQNERMCQSPDGEVVFHFPLELMIDPHDRHIVSEIGITNAGSDPVVLDEYFITTVDDRDLQYRPRFSGPDGYHHGSDKSPALVLAPQAEDRIQFSEELRIGASAVKTVTLVYKRVGDTDYTRVVVSYREGVFLGSER